ncbi:PREDICTED: calponin homology domain-containing protein DDB_G0272472-like isoform X2 [Dinoponera quadriceps]|uniref:Calponin homology domain-containing protein DDB_G0272472-like isoform X2 n=1 Tax=Dinoponera quadriceps TaxID=609295 RepID=A0A6P3Y0Q3_DINQU|nr:PREDICTED: calponin homology domain-containing protein DDB_G0272472-like isoform X2 [Dinoponera quadriceps]
MPRSTRDSDEDVEPRTGRRTRTLSIVQSMIDSPIRRSSRIKQPVKLQKFSPDSESDTNVSSNQPVRFTRQRMATMDSVTTETLRGRRTRKPSISSENSEIIDVETVTPSKRITRRSLTTVTSSTPTRASARVVSKRILRAGSETKSPPPASRTTRRTRASSVDLENMTDQTKSLILTKTLHRQASVLLQSPVKEEVEDKLQKSDVKTETKLVEEFTDPEMAAGSKESQKVQEIDDTKEEKVKEDNSCDKVTPAVTPDEVSQQLKNNEIQSKYAVATMVDKKSLDEVPSTADVPSDMSDKILTVDANSQNDKTEDKSIENEKGLAEIENSLMDICKKSSTKELTVRLEDILSTSIGEQKRNPSNKENQTLNIISDTSAEKSVGPIITSVTSLSTRSPTTVFANKSLNEKETQFARNEPSLGKRRRSKELTETTVKHITNDTVKSVPSTVDTVELVEEVLDDQTFVETVNKPDENVTGVTGKLDKDVINTEPRDKTVAWQESLCSLTANNDEMNLQLEESNVSQDKDKLPLDESMKTTAESNTNCSGKSIDVEISNDKSNAVVELASAAQDDAKDGLSDSTERIKENLSNRVTQSESPTLETINPSLNDLSAASNQDTQSRDVIGEEPRQDVSSEKTESTSLETSGISTQQKDTSGVSTEKKSSAEESMEIDADKSDVDIVSMFQDVPADNWKEDAAETKNAAEGGGSNSLLADHESEAECDLVLVDKQAWLAAENMKTVREKECSDYDSDDTMIMKSRLDATQVRKRLSTIDETLLINIDDDDEEEEEKKQEEEVSIPVEERKSSAKSKSAIGHNSPPTICIDVDSSSPVEFLNKSKEVSNRSSSQPGLNEGLEQAAEQSVKVLDEFDDEIRGDANRSSQSCRNASLRKSTDKRESLNKSSKDARRSSQSPQNNSASESQASTSEEELLDNIETHNEKNLKKKRWSSIKSNGDSDKAGSEGKKRLSGKDLLINAEDTDENDEVTQTKDLKCKKSDVNYSMLAHAGSNSNISSKSSNDTTNDPMKYYKCARNLFEKNNITDDNSSDDDNIDDDGIGSIDSDVKREYNLDAAEREYSDDNVPYDECRTSESEFSDPDDNGSDLADFIVADDAIEEGERNKREGKEKQNDEGDEREEGVEGSSANDEEGTSENNSEQVGEEDESEKSARAKTNVSKNNTSDKSFEVDRKKKVSTKHTVPRQSKEDVNVTKSHMKNIEQTIILDSSGSSIKIKRKSHMDETEEQNTMEQINESKINKRKLSKATRTSLECSTPKMNSSKQEFVSDIETAASALEAEDEKLKSASETLKRRKSRKDSTSEEDTSHFKERTDNKEKILHIGLLSSDLLEKGMSKTTGLNKTVNVTHTETPTIRDLMKEKLNESTPELRVEPSQLQKRRLSKEEDEQRNEKDSDEEVPELVALFGDNIQQHGRRKQKRRKRQTEEISNENIIENILSQDTVESDVSKKRKRKKEEKSYGNLLTVKDTTCKDTCQLTEKRKKKEIGVSKTDENGDNVQQERKKKKKKKKNQTSGEMSAENILDNVAKGKAKRQEIAVSSKEETLPGESLKKKKRKKEEKEREEENIPPPQAPKSKSKSGKKAEKSQLQNVLLSKTVESKNDAFVKTRSEAAEVIKSATERIKLKELEKRKKKKREIQEISVKRKKKHIEEQKTRLSSTGGLKRLSDNVVDKLSDTPTRAKRRKLMQNKEQAVPSTKKPKSHDSKNSNCISLSASGSTTQFSVVNLSKGNKQPSRTVVSIMSYRQRMLNRNQREPTSTYLMYLRKQRAVSNDGFSNNAF